jgi:hypothetical protein
MFRLWCVPIFILTAALYLYCFIIALQKYREKKTRLLVSLLILFISCVFINICSAVDGVFYPDIYDFQYGYALSMIFTALGIISLLYFATAVFTISDGSKKQNKNLIYAIFSVYLMIISIWAIICLSPSSPIASEIPLSIIFLSSLTVYIVIAVQSHKLAKSVEDVYYKKFISYICYYALGNILIFVFFIIDGIDPAPDGTTIWSFIGVCVFCFTAYLAYKGFIIPMKTKKEAQ